MLHQPSFLLVFFPFVCLVFKLLPRYRLYILILTSVAMLFGQSAHDLAVLVMSILFNYAFLRYLTKNESSSSFIISLFVAFNIVTLVIAKSSVAIIGFTVIPIGVSFYTFQQIGLIVDIHHKKYQAPKFKEYLFTISFFPHLAAGPIVKFSDILMQIRSKQWLVGQLDISQANLALIVIGLTKKNLIADNLSPYVDFSYNLLASNVIKLDLTHFLYATFGYGLQIYFDFSGYSDIAISLAAMLGIRFPINFNSPFQSQSVAEFWRRWHISLGSFIREYLYSPFKKKFTTKANKFLSILAIMVLVGLWHGLSISFLIWGLMHGLFITLGHAYGQDSRKFSFRNLFFTFVAVNMLWPFFRNIELNQIYFLFSTIFHPSIDDSKMFLKCMGILIGLTTIVFIIPNSNKLHSVLEEDFSSSTTLIKLIVVGMTILFGSIALMNSKISSEFIYFNF